ncbi:Putative NADH-flavin reductase [Quadrisphaera granulorum]|uniref:Putative NADH-flavin reductase n=1 Tax=Quadrisphaera granulorum TaxID=317664 RepID=A0A316A9I7_9ACTN|nr:NAD(P)H-binding protein [Quadrisphaera granulorum]PWJ54162.1 putative NADH-flavin reductase [Quadrisphaera granulorum]SZE96301.1 Putative NADH-flavin reductase [Quadrisphaera granulorum]
MRVTVFGASGPTGQLVCRLALEAGHEVRAASRRTDWPAPASTSLTTVSADVSTGRGVEEAIRGADAVLSALGTAYSRHPISVYSVGTRAILDALTAVGDGRRLVVVSSGLTYPPPPAFGFLADKVVFPLLRGIIGRSLYADMRRMEELLRDRPDVDWTVMLPGRLIDAPAPSTYRLDLDHPTQTSTARIDLAAAMVAELEPATAHVHQAVAPTTARR